MDTLSSSTQKIKQSICYRAKYRVDSKKVMCPLLVVPHPKNRGGDPVKSLRTMQLTATVAVEGYDAIEANCNAVAVEARPAVAGGCEQYFQDEFEKKAKPDPDMAERGSAGYLGMQALVGSLSHSHFNCCMRNILCSKKGCECNKTMCECGSLPILDQNRNYSLEKLRDHDAEWAQQCSSGLDWEVLSWKMDVEEPDAAQVISIALNKKNEVAMKTGHLEIMATLVGLCVPSPNGSVPFEPVRDKLIDLYGAAVDHPDFVHAFRLVMDAGGMDSAHNNDMEHFTAVHVNQKLRKMRMEVYAIVAPYPETFPRIKNACLKWSWRQAPNKDKWCQLPPSISHRLSAESKHGMPDFMQTLEMAMAALSKLASTVVESKDVRTRAKWIAEVEINLIAKVFAVPKKVEGGKTVKDQQDELCGQCAALIATKLLDLAKLGHPSRYKAGLSGLTRDSTLMQLVGKHLDDPACFLSAVESSALEKNPHGKLKSVVTEQLVPKVIAMDANGMPLSHHETVPLQTKLVEAIPWTTWSEKATKHNPNNIAKLLLLMAIDSLNHNWSSLCPIALVRKGNVIQALATKSLRVGELVVPLFVKKQNSVVTEDVGATIHPKAVSVVAKWSENADNEAGSRDVEVTLKVQPELKFPTNGAKGLEWTQSDAVHPFWFIQRTDKNEIEANADLVQQDLTHVMACSFKAVTSAAAKVSPTCSTCSLSVPFIVNTQPIEMGKEVILKWKEKDNKRKNDAAPTIAFDQILQQDKKQRRAKAKSAGA